MDLAATALGGAILDDPYATAVNAQIRNYPIPVLRDDFSWLKGKHSFQFGGLFKFIKTWDNTYLNYDEPTIGLGGNMASLTASLRPDNIRTAGTIASNTYDSAFALALGRFADINSTLSTTAPARLFPRAAAPSGNIVTTSWRATSATPIR